MADPINPADMACPMPLSKHDRVLLAHGGGGTLMRDLIQNVFAKTFARDGYTAEHDAARLTAPDGDLAFTTDSYVISPLFFPGGDIGSLAVHGTVNDLAMAGAKPLYLSAGFILEEGLEMTVLEKVTASMRAAADASDVILVTGDTKVVDRGKGDGLYINTAGIGVVPQGVCVGPERIASGDAILVSGDIGRHGLTILATRNDLGFQSDLASDSAPVAVAVQALLDSGVEVHCLRDLTRGGLAAALCELAESSGLHFDVEQERVPVLDTTRALGELLGIDPIHVANEGRFVVMVPDAQADKALEVLRALEVSAGAVRVGTVNDQRQPGAVSLLTPYGVRHQLALLSGEQLPRIC